MTPRTLLIAALVLSLPAAAADVWTTPYPGVRMLQRSTTRPIVFWALEVDTCAPGIRLRASAPAEGTRTTSSFGRLVGAQLAINGDFADHDFGLNVGNGQAWSTPDTTHSGNFSVGANRVEMTPDDVLLSAPAPWVTEQLGGRWTLLANGVPRYGIDDNGPATSGGFVCAPGLRHPRTAIGLSQDRRKVFIIVADGRSSTSVGMTCDELIDVFRELGAHDAMGLDGGGSSTLWRSDRLINHPSDAAGERTVRNHLAIFASGSGPAPHCVPIEPPQAAPVAGAALPTAQALTTPLRFTPVTSRRLFDTRTAGSSASLLRSDGATAGPLSPTSAGAFGDWAAVGVGADASAVWLNLAAVAPLAPGFLTVSAGGQPRPPTSNLNFAPGRVAANAALVSLGAARRVDFAVSTSVHLIGDLSGTFAAGSGAGFVPSGPTRVLDTRMPAARLQAGVTRAVDVRAPAGAVAVSATVTAVVPDASGFLTAAPCGAPVPPTSSLNFVAGAVVANAVVSGLGSGQLCLTSTADTDVIIDVSGFFLPTAPLAYVPLSPRRLLDTRGTTTLFTGRVAAGQVLQLPVQAMPGMPANVGAAVVNVAALEPSGAGFVTVFPCGGAAPATSSLNFPADSVVSGLALVGVGPGGLCLVSSTRAHLIVDVLGAWVPAPLPPADAGVGGPGGVDGGVVAPGDVDAGSVEGGVADAGSVEAGAADAGSVEVTAADAGSLAPASDDTLGGPEVQGGCSASPGAAAVLLAVALCGRTRRQRRR